MLNELLNKKDSIIETFYSVRQNVEEEISSLIEGWKLHNKMFEDGDFGYEVFLLEKVKKGNFISRFCHGGDKEKAS